MRPATDNYISVHSGISFPFTKPKAEHFDINDIAHSLSLQCRYNGHCAEFYSVAEHSVHVSKWVASETGSARKAFDALMHDGSEAYICDVPRPIKPFLDPGYGALEHTVEMALAKKYGLTFPWCNEIKVADSRICLDEYRHLFEARLGPCTWTLPFSEPLGIRLDLWEPKEAKRQFLSQFANLTKGAA